MLATIHLTSALLLCQVFFNFKKYILQLPINKTRKFFGNFFWSLKIKGKKK